MFSIASILSWFLHSNAHDGRGESEAGESRSFAKNQSSSDFPSGGQGIQQPFDKLVQLGKNKRPDYNGDISRLPLEKPVRIAVLDSGVNLEHKAFARQNIAVTDDKRVKNFVPAKAGSKLEELSEDAYKDSDGHGTFCAGIVVGDFRHCKSDKVKTNKYSWGVAPFAELLVGKVLRNKRRGNGQWLADGIDWSVEQGADIISISSGQGQFSSALTDSIYKAMQKGIIVVCCASNDGRTNTSTIAYPAKLGNVVCVGSHGSHGEASNFSGVGREIEFLAPGEEVWSSLSSTDDKQKLGKNDGTSLATPYIAGVCALILAFSELVGGPVLRQKVSDIMVMKYLLRNMASQPGVHDQFIGYGSVNPYRIFKFSSDHLKKTVDAFVLDTVEEKLPLETIHGLVPGTRSDLGLDFRKPIELLFQRTASPALYERLYQMKFEVYSTVARYISSESMIHHHYHHTVKWPKHTAVVADLRLSDSIENMTGLEFQEGLMVRLNFQEIIENLFESCEALQLIKLAEVPKAEDLRIMPSRPSDSPFFVHLDTVRMSQLQQFCCNAILIATLLDVDMIWNDELKGIDSHLCIYVDNITGNIPGNDGLGEYLVCDFNMLKAVNCQFSSSFKGLDEMESETRHTFEHLLSLSGSEMVFSPEEHIYKIGALYKNYVDECAQKLQPVFDEAVRCVMENTEVKSPIRAINLQLPETSRLTIDDSDEGAWEITGFNMFYGCRIKRQKRLELGNLLKKIARASRVSEAELYIAYLPATLLKDVYSVMSCPIIRNCKVVDLGLDLDLFELVTWVSITDKCIQNPITLRCSSVIVTNSINLLDIPVEEVVVNAEKVVLEIHEVIFNSDSPPWTTLPTDILALAKAYLVSFTGINPNSWMCYHRLTVGQCCTQETMQDCGLTITCQSSTNIKLYRHFCSCPWAQNISDLLLLRQRYNVPPSRMSEEMLELISGASNCPDGRMFPVAVVCAPPLSTMSANDNNLTCEQLLAQFVLSGGQDNETYYGSRIECRSRVQLHDFVPGISIVPNFQHVPVKRKIVYLNVANPRSVVDSNHLADSLIGMLRQEEEGKLPVAKVVAIPCGFVLHNQRLFWAICEVSRKGKIVLTAALKTSARHSLSEIAFAGCYGDVLVIGSPDEKGNVPEPTPRGRELDFLLRSSCPQNACILVADMVAIILERAHRTGGDPLVKAICHNCVMRELLRLHCSARLGCHDFVHGYGELNRADIFSFSDDDFKRAVADITVDFLSEEP